MGIFVGLAPWILYWVLVSDNSFEEAAVAGLVAAIALTIWGFAQGKPPKILDYGTIAWFAILVIMAGTADEEFFADWSYVLSNFALAAIVLVSIAIGQPFTRPYAQEEVPRENWNSPLFLQATLVIAWFWLGVFVLMGGSAFIATQDPDNELWWNWVIPIGLLIVGIKFNHWYPDRLREQTQARAGA